MQTQSQQRMVVKAADGSGKAQSWIHTGNSTLGSILIPDGTRVTNTRLQVPMMKLYLVEDGIHYVKSTDIVPANPSQRNADGFESAEGFYNVTDQPTEQVIVVEPQSSKVAMILGTVGFLGGLYYAFSKKPQSKFWGFVGWGFLGTVVGSSVGKVIDLATKKK